MRHSNIPASYLIFEKDDKILLLRRFQTGYCDGEYSLVAGHVDPGETFTACAIREAREEAGVDIKNEDLKMVHILHRDSKDQKDNERVDVFFHVQKWNGDIQNMEPHKCDDLSWFSVDNLPKNTIPYVYHVLTQIKEGNVYSEFGWESVS